jgi:class 3 adenylate cyclase
MAESVVDKVVVVIDLSRYSDVCKELEQQLDVTAVGALNDQIKALIGLALATASIKPGSPPYKGTGDGAIIALDTPAEASLFAEKLHKAAEERNLGRDVPLAQRHFRVGIWRGKLLLRPEPHGKGYPTTFDFAGTAISNAVRLEGACTTGEVLIGSDVWADLPADDRKWYGAEELVEGKRAERFRAHRRRVVAPAPWDAAPTAPSGAGKPAAPATSASSELGAIYKQRLEVLQQQAAFFGAYAPPHITMEIQNIKRVLADLES